MIKELLARVQVEADNSQDRLIQLIVAHYNRPCCAALRNFKAHVDIWLSACYRNIQTDNQVLLSAQRRLLERSFKGLDLCDSCTSHLACLHQEVQPKQEDSPPVGDLCRREASRRAYVHGVWYARKTHQRLFRKSLRTYTNYPGCGKCYGCVYKPTYWPSSALPATE